MKLEKEELIGSGVFLVSIALVCALFSGRYDYKFDFLINNDWFFVPALVISSAVMLISSLVFTATVVGLFSSSGPVKLKATGVDSDGLVVYRPIKKSK